MLIKGEPKVGSWGAHDIPPKPSVYRLRLACYTTIEMALISICIWPMYLIGTIVLHGQMAKLCGSLGSVRFLPSTEDAA